eukprot:6555235-Prymnesium_polylepis.1
MAGTRKRLDYVLGAARGARLVKPVTHEEDGVLALEFALPIVRGHSLLQQRVDAGILPLVEPRAAGKLAFVEPEGRPQEGGLDKLLGKGFAVLEAARQAHVDVRPAIGDRANDLAGAEHSDECDRAALGSILGWRTGGWGSRSTAASAQGPTPRSTAGPRAAPGPSSTGGSSPGPCRTFRRRPARRARRGRRASPQAAPAKRASAPSAAAPRRAGSRSRAGQRRSCREARGRARR